MHKTRWLVIPILMVFMLGCGLLSDVQNIQNAATTALPAIQTAESTDLPAMETAAATDLPAMETAASTEMPALLTALPTGEGMIGTAAAMLPTSSCTGTPTSGGLGVSVDTARAVLQMTQQFSFTTGSANGQSAVVATLTTSGATSFPAISQGFTAQFIGDVCNLSEILVTIPRTDSQDTVDQGESVLNLVLAGTIPPDVQLAFLTWVAQNYPNVAVSGQQQTTINAFQFTLRRDQANMVLDVLPAK